MRRCVVCRIIMIRSTTTRCWHNAGKGRPEKAKGQLAAVFQSAARGGTLAGRKHGSAKPPFPWLHGDAASFCCFVSVDDA